MWQVGYRRGTCKTLRRRSLHLPNSRCASEGRRQRVTTPVGSKSTSAIDEFVCEISRDIFWSITILLLSSNAGKWWQLVVPHNTLCFSNYFSAFFKILKKTQNVCCLAQSKKDSGWIVSRHEPRWVCCSVSWQDNSARYTPIPDLPLPMFWKMPSRWTLSMPMPSLLMSFLSYEFLDSFIVRSSSAPTTKLPRRMPRTRVMFSNFFYWLTASRRCVNVKTKIEDDFWSEEQIPRTRTSLPSSTPFRIYQGFVFLRCGTRIWF